MNEELKYTASATGFDKVEKALKDQAAALTGVNTAATKLVGGPLKQLPVSFEGLSFGARKAEQALATIPRNSNSAALALNNLGRIAQDAPFGFLGISNNINPLLESFQRLKAESGSTTIALKSLGSSLIGAGGIGLAVSAVSALLVLFGDKLFAGNKAIESTNFELIEFAANIDNAKESLKSFNVQADNLLKLFELNIQQAFGSGFKAKLENAEGAFITLGDKIKETEKTVDLFAANSSKAFRFFLDNASKETIKFVSSFNDNLLSIPDDAISKLPESQQEFVKATKDATKALVDEQAVLKQLREQQVQSSATIRAITADEARAEDERKRKEAERLAKLPTFAKLIKELAADIDNLNTKHVLFGTNEADNKIKLIQSAILKAIKDFDIGIDNTVIKKWFGDIETIRPLVLEAIKVIRQTITANPIVAPIKPVIVLPPLETSKELIEFGKQLTSTLQNMATEAGAAFGEALGNAITGSGDIGDFFTGIFNVIGDGLKTLGKQLIQAAALMLIVQETLSSNPYTALLAGVALVALGQILKNSIGSKKAFAKGGFVGGTGNTDSVNALLMPGEFVMTKAAVQRIGVGNLSALNSGVSAPVSFSGGISAAEPMVFIADSIISGNDIVLSYRRATATKSRIG